MVLLPFKGKDLVLDRFGFGSRSRSQLSSERIQIILHLFLSRICFIFSVSLDKLLLLRLQITNLLVYIHLFFVEGRLILDTLVEEHSELVSLMDAVNEDCQ